jgi:hypothetical protein
MLEGHLTDHEPNRNLPHPFQNNTKTLATVRLDVFRWHRSVYYLQQASTLLGTSQWTHWRCVIATIQLKRNPWILSIILRTFSFLPWKFLLSLLKWTKISDRYASLAIPWSSESNCAYSCSRSVKNACTCYQSSKRELIPFYLIPIIHPREAGERCVHNPAPGTKLQKSREVRHCDVIVIQHSLRNTGKALAMAASRWVRPWRNPISGFTALAFATKHLILPVTGADISAALPLQLFFSKILVSSTKYLAARSS